MKIFLGSGVGFFEKHNCLMEVVFKFLCNGCLLYL
jgi:hypothetical protein